MARVEFSFLVDSITGSSGGTTFQRNNGVNVMHNKVNPVARNTNSQILSRNNFAELRATWSTLSEERKLAWNELALLVPETGSPGVLKPKRGYILFMKFNRIPYLYGDSITLDAPNTYQTSNIVFWDWERAPITDLIVLCQTDVAQPDYYFSVWGRTGYAGPRSGRLSPWKKLFFDKVTTLAAQIATEWEDTFGFLEDGIYSEIRVQIQAEGFFPSNKQVLGKLMD